MMYSNITFQGILYVDEMTVGWRPIARAWLENRSQHEVHVCDSQLYIIKLSNGIVTNFDVD